ncbi:MAG: serine hydrolase, partial [Acidobacteriota bacterium]|nr:serine hydrolase [Acidobacteriota bacterium]
LRVLAFVTAALLSAPVFAQQGSQPRNDLPQPYTTTRTWGELPPGVKWAAVTAIEPAPDGTIYVVHRCFENSCANRPEAPILKYNAAGKLLGSFGQGQLIFPHGGTVDREGNLWMTDAGSAPGKGHQAIKFSPDGKILMTLGQAGVSGSGPDLFDQPTDVVVAPNGDLFITDSHRNGKNNRVMHFTRDGKFIKQWGRKGQGRGELSEPHTIAMDSRGRLFVGDRENNRIVIYNQDGEVLDEWRQFGRPSGIVITSDDTIYVADSESWGTDTGARELPGIKKGIRIGSARDGLVTAFIEDQESTAADHAGAEGVGVDAAGHVYGGVVRRRMLERHVKKDGAAAAGRADDPLASPESVGFSANGLKAYQQAMRALVDEGKLAGVTTLVARHGKVVQFDAYGVQDLETKKPVTKDTIFRIASMTKPIAGVAMMMLWEQGKWTLDDPVAKHIPEFASLKVATANGEVAQATPMTMRQLMSHSAGFDVSGGYAKHNINDRSQPLQAMIDKLAKLPLAAQPGTDWRYGPSVDIQGYLVEKLSGQTLDVFLRTQIFDPLGMKDT